MQTGGHVGREDIFSSVKPKYLQIVLSKTLRYSTLIVFLFISNTIKLILVMFWFFISYFQQLTGYHVLCDTNLIDS